MSQKLGLEAPERALGTAACSWAAGTGWAPAGPGSYRDQIDQKWWRNGGEMVEKSSKTLRKNSTKIPKS